MEKVYTSINRKMTWHIGEHKVVEIEQLSFETIKSNSRAGEAFKTTNWFNSTDSPFFVKHNQNSSNPLPDLLTSCGVDYVDN